MEAIRILVVEDDPDINQLLCTIMSDAGYQCQPAFSGSEAMLWAERERFDLVLLDLMLPGLTGEEFITRIRRGRTMPIIVLSAKAGLEDKVNVLRLGADDFIPKPFDNLEVLARVEAQLRRVQKFSAPPERRQFVCGDLILDREEFSVIAGGEPVVLTAREFEILALLMEYPKRVFTREQIYQYVWGEEYFGDDNTVNVHISNLRAKLGRVSDREYIKTVWGIGFKMAEPLTNMGELRRIPGIGVEGERDLLELGYTTIQSLVGADPEEMYARECARKGVHVDRCVLYVYRCAVYYASTPQPDPEKLKWWAWKDGGEKNSGHPCE